MEQTDLVYQRRIVELEQQVVRLRDILAIEVLSCLPLRAFYIEHDALIPRPDWTDVSSTSARTRDAAVELFRRQQPAVKIIAIDGIPVNDDGVTPVTYKTGECVES